jgi:hypothetical protein
MNQSGDRFRPASANSVDSSATDSSNTAASSSRRTPFNRFNQPRLYGPITTNMIDDFLNPLSFMKDPQNRYNVDLKLTSMTGGRGIVRPPSEFNETMQGSENVLNRYDAVVSGGDSSTVSYHYMSDKEKKKVDFDYVKLREEFENELRGMHKENMSNVHGGGDSHSVVGSSLSQMESVSALSCTTAVRAGIQQAASHLVKMRIDEHEDESLLYVDDNNNAVVDQVGDLMKEANAGRLVNPKSDLQRCEEHLEELRKNYQVRNEYEYADLPIRAFRQKILECIDSNKFVVIEGGTGCGKTTYATIKLNSFA